MKKCSTKIIALALALVMVFTCNVTPTFAKSNLSLKITTNKSTLYLLDSANSKSQLKVTYGGKNVTKSAKYSTSNNNIATVNKNGTITAKRAGTVKVKAKYKKLSCSITIKVKNAKLSLNKKSVTLTTGETYTLKALANRSTVSNKNVKWSTSNNNIATVNKNGTVTAKKAGNTKITCSTSIGKVTCTVTVKAKEDVPSDDGDSDNGGKCTTHNWVVTKNPVTKWQMQCLGCGQWFDGWDDFSYHGFVTPVNERCGACAPDREREVVVIPGTETCTICGETRQLYNVGDVISGVGSE